MRLPVIEVDGKRYMDSRAAARLWNISPRTVARYCREQRVPGAFKDSGGRWCIPMDAIRPLTDSTLRDVLILTLHLQANPGYAIDYPGLGINPSELGQAYTHLALLGYIQEFDIATPSPSLPFEVKLTNRGVDLVSGGEIKKTQDIAEVLQRWAPAIASIISRLATGS